MSKGHPEFYKLIEEIVALHDAKNHDYSADEDPLENFKLCEKMDIPAWKGTLVRIADKYSRIVNFARKGNLEVMDESIEDTLKDLAVYSLLTIILYRESKRIRVNSNISGGLL